MSARLRQLARLHQLRVVRERLREAEFAATQRKVLETEDALRRMQALRRQAVCDGREGLLGGEWERWWMGESSDALAERAMGELGRAREERMMKAAEAQMLLLAARREAEQSKLLEQAAREASRAEAEKRAQAESDDRFAARVHWNLGVAAKRLVAGS